MSRHLESFSSTEAPGAPADPSLHDAHVNGNPRVRRAHRGAVFGVTAGLMALAIGAVLLIRPKRPPLPPPTLRVEQDAVKLTEDAPQWRYVQLATAEESPPLVPLPAPGRVDFDESQTASVGAPLNGRVEQVLVRFGDRVRKGDKLFSIRSGAFAELEKEIASSREAVSVKGRMAQRIAELVSLRAAPEKDLLAAQAELREAELALRSANAKKQSLAVAAAGDNLFWVTAPRDGSIVDHDVFASQEVRPDRDGPLMKISDLDQVLVIADFGEADAADLRVGQPVTVHAQGSQVEREGTIERVSEVVDPRRRTVEVRVRVPNGNHPLRPNGFAEVSIQPDPEVRRIQVPSEAVVTDGERSVVFVLVSPGHLKRTPVQPGRERNRRVEIRSGLQPGARYVSRGALLLLNQVELDQQ